MLREEFVCRLASCSFSLTRWFPLEFLLSPCWIMSSSLMSICCFAKLRRAAANDCSLLRLFADACMLFCDFWWCICCCCMLCEFMWAGITVVCPPKAGWL